MSSKKELIKIREQLKENLEESIIIFNKLHQELKEVEAEMEKYRKTILGLEYKRLDDGFYQVEVNCDFPQQSKSTQLFYNCLEEYNIKESGIQFPIRLIHWVDTINPLNKETIMNYYNIDLTGFGELILYSFNDCSILLSSF
jgi:hypothetical protein